MSRLTILLLSLLLSTVSFAREWSQYGVVSQLELYDGNTLSFVIQANNIETVSCHSNQQKFILDVDNLAKPDTGIALLIAAHAAGSVIRVLPSYPDACIGGSAKISTISFQD